MGRRAAFLLVLAALSVAGCSRPGGNQNAKAGASEATGVPVEAKRAELGTMLREVPVTGTISALRKADIKAQISGQVASVSVRQGDAVSAGQVVVTLDRAELESQASQARAGVAAARAQLGAARKRLEIVQLGARQEERSMAASRLEQAEAALRQAAADRERMRSLFQQGAVSKQQLDASDTAYETARTNRDSARDSLTLTQKGARPEEIEAARKEVEAAEAGLEQAQAGLSRVGEMLGYTVIRSPVSGVVYERNLEPGEVVSPGGLPLLRVANLASVYLEARVSERLAGQVKAGQPAKVALQSVDGGDLDGVVQRLVPVADPGSRDFLVQITITGGNGRLRPGVFAQARIVSEERKNVVVIPKDALVSRGEGHVVFVVKAGKAQERKVEAGLLDRTRAEVVSGLKPGDLVVSLGAQALKDGDAVQLVSSGGD